LRSRILGARRSLSLAVHIHYDANGTQRTSRRFVRNDRKGLVLAVIHVPRTAITFTLPKRSTFWVEVAAVAGVLTMAITVRLVRLGSVPRIVTADEADNLMVAYRIIHGTGPGIFGFDWKPAPIFSLYPLAWAVRIFGDGVSDFRMFPVVLSVLTMILFYLLVRRTVGVPAALLGLVLLATNLWVLHFSRTAWENMNAALFAVGACWTTMRAIETGNRWWWVGAGIFVAFGFYGYFSGRLIFVAVTLIALIAVATRQAPWRRTLAGLCIAAVVSAVLFAPQAYNIVDEWDRFNRRTDTVSVFSADPEGEHGWGLAWTQLRRNYSAFVLQDGSEIRHGLWSRYGPSGRAPLDWISAHFFWAGLVVAAFRWRQTYAWFPFFVPLFIVQSFSGGTPDLARGLIIAPFYFLFIAIAFDELFRRIRRVPLRAAAISAALVVTTFVAYDNVRDYFAWQDLEAVQRARLPGVDICEFDAWRELAQEHASVGGTVVPAEQFQAIRDELACSEIIEYDN
jgi:hypothetical protein